MSNDIKSEDISFNVIDWQSLDMKIKGKKQFVVRAFGRDEYDESVCLQIKDFKPYFYFEIEQQIEGLPNEEWTNITSTIKEKKINIHKILNSLHSSVNAEFDAYINSTDENKRQKEISDKTKLLKKEVFDEKADCPSCSLIKFDYFRDNQKDNFFKIEFITKRAFNLYKKIFKRISKDENFRLNFDKDDLSDNVLFLQGKRIRFIQYESNIEPIIRFFHKREINPSGWISVNNVKPTIEQYKMSQCANEYMCKSNMVEPIQKDDIAAFKIASFDIECTSEDGNFPQAYKKNDKIIQIGITTHLQGEKIPYEHCMITLEPCNDLDKNTNVKNGLLIKCKTEEDLLREFKYYIVELDPDIITGYNIWGFDWMYMYERAKKLEQWNGEKTGFTAAEFCKMSRIGYETCRYVEKSLSSSALGDNLLKYIEMTGRVQVDLLKLVQKDYNLSSYKLNSVSQEFLQGDVEFIYDGDYAEEEKKLMIEQKLLPIHRIKTKSIDGLFVDNQISLIDQYDNKVEDGYKFTITKLDEKNKIITIKENIYQKINAHIGELEEEYESQKIPFNEDDIKYRWCENKIDLTPNDIFDNFKKGTDESMREIAIYCIKDCVLCNSLLVKLDVITKNIGMSNVCCVPLSYLFLRGQGVKIFSVIAQECQKYKFIIPVITKEDYEGDSSYEGAIVLKPNIGIYHKPVAVMDYSSLYPSSMISENISHDSLMKIMSMNKD